MPDCTRNETLNSVARRTTPRLAPEYLQWCESALRKKVDAGLIETLAGRVRTASRRFRIERLLRQGPALIAVPRAPRAMWVRLTDNVAPASQRGATAQGL